MNLKGEQKWHTEGIVTTKAEELQEFRRAFLGWTPQEPEHGSFPSSQLLWERGSGRQRHCPAPPEQTLPSDFWKP